MDIIPYDSSITRNNEPITTGAVILAILAVAAIQNCSSTQEQKPLRISIPVYVETPPASPSIEEEEVSTPPAAPAPASTHSPLDTKILQYLKKNPSSTAKDILTILHKTDPNLTKSDINSRLYTMFHKKFVLKITVKGVPNWFHSKQAPV